MRQMFTLSVLALALWGFAATTAQAAPRASAEATPAVAASSDAATVAEDLAASPKNQGKADEKVKVPKEKPKRSKKNDDKDDDPDDGNAGGGNDDKTLPNDGPEED